jgi:15,16-dihydrobiliverdin:ferredoxin oxidoreductase
MDELFDKSKRCIEERIRLEPVELPPELVHITLPFKIFDLRCYNWKAEKIRKIYFMRIKVAIPYLDIFGMAIYPDATTDMPGFAFDFSCTKKKVFGYVNCIPLFNETAYLSKYIEPMNEVRARCGTFPPQTVREWMKPYHTPYTIYTFPPTSYLSELKKCAFMYLGFYLDLFARAEIITDPGSASRVEEARRSYVNALLSNDNSQKMLGKIIGRERARRLFHEVVT